MEETINLFDYFAVLKRRKWVLVSTLIIIFSSVTIATFRQVPTYQATAVISIEISLPSIIPFQSPYPQESSYYNFYHIRDYFRTQYEILHSRDIAQRVLDNLDLRNSPEFRHTPDPEQKFMSAVNIEPVKESLLVKIHYQHHDPEKAARYANGIAQAYQDRIFDEKRNIGREAVGFLSEQLQDIDRRIKSSEASSVQFLEDRDIYSLEEAIHILHSEIRNLYQELSEIQKEQRELKHTLQEIEGHPVSSPGFLNARVFQDNQLVQTLKEKKLALEAQVANLEAQYKAGHPRLLRPESELNEINKQIRSEVEDVTQGITLQLQGLNEREKTIRKEIDRHEQEATNLNQYSVEYFPIKRNVDTNRKIYDALLTRFQETRIFTEMVNTNVKLIEQAQVPLSPFRPNRRLNVLLSLLVGLGLGTGLAFFFEYLETVQATIREGKDVEERLGLPLLGTVSVIQSDLEELIRNYRENRDSPFYEGLRFLRANLKFAASEESRKRILFASFAPQEGKTMVMGSLAKVLADNEERVVVMDTDFRAPAVGTFFDIPSKSGLTDYLSGECGIEDIVIPTAYPNLDIIFSGDRPPTTLSLLEDEKLEALLDHLGTRYDRIFFEAPPMGYYSDGLALSRLSDGVILLIYRGKSRVEDLRRIKKQLEDVKAPLLGAVFNGFEFKSRAYYSSYYQYYNRFRESKERDMLKSWGQRIKDFIPWRKGESRNT